MTHRDELHAWLLRQSDRLLLALIALAIALAGATGQATELAHGSQSTTATPAAAAIDLLANAAVAVIGLTCAVLTARSPLRARPR